jgi:hypothetical protein
MLGQRSSRRTVGSQRSSGEYGTDDALDEDGGLRRRHDKFESMKKKK